MGIFSIIQDKIEKISSEDKTSSGKTITHSKIEEHYFYRSLSGEYKYSSNSPENLRLVLVNRAERSALCPIHGKWERCTSRNGKLVFSCGRVNTDILLDFSPVSLPSPPPKLEFDEALGRDIELPPTESEIESHRYGKWGEINEKVLDENKISRDLAYIRVVDNITLSQIHVELVFLDRIRAQNPRKCIPAKLFQTALRFEFSFDIKKNESFSRCRSDKVENWQTYNRQTWEKESVIDKLPKNVEDFVADKARAIIRRNWGAKLTLDFSGTGFAAVRAMMDYPFEPGLHAIKEKVRNFPVGRFDMNGYNATCDFLGIKSFKTLRKAYIENPLTLLSYKGLNDSGFTDKNLIIKTLGEPVAKLFVWTCDSSIHGIADFCRLAIAVRGEGPVLTMLSHNLRDAEKIGRPEICRDTAELAAKWLYDDDEMTNLTGRHAVRRPRNPQNVTLPESLKNDLLQNGLTKDNHDALTELDYLATHKVITFKYLRKELTLEDDIYGYSFRLPEDSKQLYSIGQTLHNCVGNYAQRVQRHECVIVYATKDGEYRLCIEVRDMNQVWQQRTDYNNDPTGTDALVMQKWRAKHKLSFSGNSF